MAQLHGGILHSGVLEHLVPPDLLHTTNCLLHLPPLPIGETLVGPVPTDNTSQHIFHKGLQTVLPLPVPGQTGSHQHVQVFILGNQFCLLHIIKKEGGVLAS